jgi:hypothetical protein
LPKNERVDHSIYGIHNINEREAIRLKQIYNISSKNATPFMHNHTKSFDYEEEINKLKLPETSMYRRFKNRS